MTTDRPANLRRRTLLEALPALLAGAPALGQAQQNDADALPSTRLALLVGNRDYPEPDDLPPTHKNVHDLRAALELRGFSVTDALDVDAAKTRQAIETFAASVKSGPPDTVAFFYFTGHGLQLDAESLLVGAGTSPKAKAEVLGRSSVSVMKDVVERMPQRPDALTICVIDACRTNIRAAVQASDGLNQIEVPPGFLVAFSTGAGKPAIAPASANLSTFYTASLVKLLKVADAEATWSDFFSVVRLDVLNTMRNHPVEAVRALAQDSFIAKDVRRPVTLARPTTGDKAEADPPSAAPRAPDDLEDWAAVDQSIWPQDVSKLADGYLQRHPQGRRATAALAAREGAKEASQVLKRTDVRLYRTAFNLADDMGEELRADIHKSARGDKDAAARVARSYRDGNSPSAPGRYEGWLQYAAGLGNGIAAYELALHYRRSAQPLLASQFESRARELGYTPPPTLDHYRK
ncbi:caspase domain-containing protein [Roseateles sp. BYS78W]|uniref:Caspase domain-containing protein n=2 Tax=Pelomonas candidula TaxID=3299025 RepID=A0ABW7HKZ7_9BURK